MDVKDFYLNNHMDRDKYIMIQISMVPQYFVEIYNLTEKEHNGYIYSRVTKGMYGLSQAGRISNDYLLKHLEVSGYNPSGKTLHHGNMTVDQ